MIMTAFHLPVSFRRKSSRPKPEDIPIIKTEARSQPSSPSSRAFPSGLKISVEKTTTTTFIRSPQHAVFPQTDNPNKAVEIPRHLAVPRSARLNMDTPPVTASPLAPISFLVLLPTSVETRALLPTNTASRPLTLQSRQSGSNVQTLKALKPASHAEESREAGGEEEAEIDKVVSAGRRLSLAPGIGAGTQTRTQPYQDRLGTVSSSPPLEAADPPPSAPLQTSKPPAFGAPAFGSASRAPGVRGASRRRPQTAATPALPPAAASSTGIPRGSFAMPSQGMGMAGGVGKSKPGWEADEVVSVLRSGGLEVTVIRNTQHLPSILSPQSSSPTFNTFNQQTLAPRPSTPTPLTHVILVPLSDPPSLPSLSLLLAQGTTPSAVCFQQDLLERARKSEDEWLPNALDQIAAVSEMRDRATLANSGVKLIETPVILAYSANPTLPQATIAAVIAAGASGVLKPPYDSSTSRLVRRMVRAARDGRISSVVGLHFASGALSPANDEGDPFVVLPPTALGFGAEHESEKVLSAAVRSHKRNMSGQWDSRSTSPFSVSGAGGSQNGRSREYSAPSPQPPRKLSIHQTQPFTAGLATSSSVQSIVTPTTAFPPTASFPSSKLSNDQSQSHLFPTHLYAQQPTVEPRRRSVDVSGLGMALQRAQKAFEAVPSSSAGGGNGLGVKRFKEMYILPSTVMGVGRVGEGGGGEGDTEFAELLSELFCQTQLAIGVEMDDCEELSKPLLQDDRNRLVDALGTWNFKPHHLDENDLYRVACLLFEGVLETDGLAELEIGRDQINRLLFAIRAIYHAPNPYHNYIHAIDVLQATYTFLIGLGLVPPFGELRYPYKPTQPRWARSTRKSEVGEGTRLAREILRPQDVLALLIAAMGHDVGHPGLSNAFEKNAGTPLFQVYDGKSVLENMHCMLISRLLRTHGFSFLLSSTNFPPTSNTARNKVDTKSFRDVLYSSVLATDMSLHFAWIDELKAFEREVRDGEDRRDDEEARVMICQALIKCADISNPTRPIDVSEHWSTVLLQEWAVQASLETALQLPVSVSLGVDAVLQAKGQIGFIDLFCQGLFRTVSDVLPEMQPYADACAANRQTWQNRLARLTAEETSPLIQLDYPDAVRDPRLSTLFPLLLPPSLITKPTNSTSTAQPVSAEPPVTPRKSVVVGDVDSPATKAMRAVYHANLLDPRHRLSSWSRGTPIPGVRAGDWVDVRRSSTPDGIMMGDRAVV